MIAPRLMFSALLGGATIVFLSCGDPSPAGVGPRALTAFPVVDSVVASARSSSGLLTCTPLPYDSVTGTIGPAGGFLQVGPHILAVPPGALDSAVTITAVAPSDTVSRVRLQPEGLTFQKPAFLLLSYANCSLFGSTAPAVDALASEQGRPQLRIAYVTDLLDILYYLPSLPDGESQTVIGLLRHFSDY